LRHSLVGKVLSCPTVVIIRFHRGVCVVSAHDMYDKTLALLQQHHKWFQESIPLIASENVPSPAVREALTSDFGNRYAEGWPGERVYAGDVMMALSIPSGGHITMGKKKLGGTAGAVHGLVVEYLPLDYKEMNINVEKAKERISKLAKEGRTPRLVMFGGSVFPFPHPVKELEAAVHDVGASVGYDAAHVAGLIAGGMFQDPLREGADVMSMSTHKTFFGPQHGGVLSWDKYADRIKRATFPSMVSNHHLHALAGVTIACAEMLEFGPDYVHQIVKNSKALGQALYEHGLNVLAEHKGFTESHVIIIDITKQGDGGTIEEQLEKANVIINRNLLPWDIKEGRHFQHPGGIRLGTSEVTRLGMKENEMKEIAEFIKRVVIDKEDVNRVKADVAEFRKGYQRVHYCFENATEAYKYIKIR